MMLNPTFYLQGNIEEEYMKGQEQISIAILSFIKRNTPPKEEEEWEVIKYGIDATIMNSYKAVLLVALGAYLGILEYLLIAFLSFGLLRTFAGGFHLKQDWTCLILTTSVFLGIVYAGIYTNLPFIIELFVYLIGLMLVVLYSPADTEDKPYVNPKVRKRLKIGAIIVTISYIILTSTIFRDTITGNIIIYSLAFESFFITPFAYKIMGRRYRNYEHYQKH